MGNSRLFNTIRNISWRAVVLFLTAIANLIIPRYIILIYGSDVNGLTSSIAQLLAVVNLIQAGLGSSVTYLMYRPIENNDRVALANIIQSAKRIYKYISLFVSVIGIVASVVFAYVVKTELQKSFILIASLMTCLNSAASTYFTAVPNVFLGAKQDGYLVSRVTILSNSVGYILNVLVIIFKPHFMLLYVINIVTCVINIVGLTRCYDKQYKKFEPTEEEKKHIQIIPIPGISYAAANEIAHSVVNSSITIAISMIAGLKASSVFAVYMIAISVVSTLSNAVYSAVVPSLGAVYAEDDVDKLNNIFEIYQFSLSIFNAFMYMCVAYLMVPFVRLYTNGATDVNYINNTLMVLLVLYGIFSVLRIPYNNVVYIAGKFKETYLQPVICAVISLGLMLFFTKISYTYTIIGAIFFFFANTFYQHFKLPKIIPGFNNKRFWNHLIVIVIGIIIAMLAYYFFPISPDNFIKWIGDACITCVCAFVILTVLLLLFDRKSTLLTVKYFYNKIKK